MENQIKTQIRTEVMKIFNQEADVDDAVKNILLLFSEPVCSCRPNTGLYSETTIRCNKCHKEVKTVRT